MLKKSETQQKNKFKLDFKTFIENIFSMRQYPTEKSISETDADLTQNEMYLYLSPSRKLNLRGQTPISGVIVL